MVNVRLFEEDLDIFVVIIMRMRSKLCGASQRPDPASSGGREERSGIPGLSVHNQKQRQDDVMIITRNKYIERNMKGILSETHYTFTG